MNTHPPAEQMRFVEEMGLLMEENNQPRIAGRILGWLLICNPPHQSFNDLVEVLQASKGSISNMTRLLLQIGLIEKVSLPGDRQTYFRIRPESWRRILQRQMSMVERLCQVADHGLDLLRDAPDEQRRRLQEMRDFNSFFRRKLPELIDEFESTRPRS